MATVSLCYSAPPAPAHFSKLGFHQNPNSRIPSTHSTSILRFKNGSGLLISKRLPLLRAVNKPPGEPEGNTEAITNSDTSTAQGPPFLTILAGIVVFGLILWAIGSIVLWLVGLLSLVFSK